ncbi:hypothetical protein WICANDRAFT_64604 [Wickerhamomyces anomalus NRRL Y-366-8]|uniref:Uncharacterized protein n=1 Tax=Wickerhamomyces anomalus (strain ATCC 58044 / CBS 1984 / NCYC 433 / NRRL Y-366-8) TaxID=683960 RepID=A0A1E3NZJ2_WICAA|nr:uncharacterized protein WICANDRAFT_64604 [Wickerhamomyces anomalus NRRL Y-366-8]ODQ58468.1 hypothetical protein WICANDRAFT_64604 [Wickerhamomyces anomalus NRRL Y-366-8]
MRFSTFVIFTAAVASSFVAGSDDDDDHKWVTYTRNLGSGRKLTLTRYQGSVPLVGSEYETKTIVVSNDDGSPRYTETVTGRREAVEERAATSEESSDPDWVTYTKNLPDTTVTVTRYQGSTPLTGTEYQTRTIVVSNEDGSPKYTEVITGRRDPATETAKASAASEESSSDPEWVTYTKSLADKTIVVTRYQGSTPLSGTEYQTRTIVVSNEDGSPKYTEVITGRRDPSTETEVAQSSSSKAEAKSSATSAESESSSSGRVSTYTGAAKTVGLSFGALAFGGVAAFFI